jgi:hypothetical protein
MILDRWEQRSGLWVRRRDDGDWDYFPSLCEPASGYRVKAAFFDRLELAGFAGRALGYGVGLPILCLSLVILATQLDLGILGDARSRGMLYIVGLVVVVAAGFLRPIVRQAALKRAAASDTVLSLDELQGLAGRLGSATLDDRAAPRPAISVGARKALTFAIGAMAVLAVVVFLIAFAIGLELTMLVAGIVATLCLLVAIRLWRLDRGTV